MPIPANLSHGPVGYIGPRNLVLEQLQLLVMQLATFHSYHDVQFITILPEEEKAMVLDALASSCQTARTQCPRFCLQSTNTGPSSE